MLSFYDVKGESGHAAVCVKCHGRAESAEEFLHFTEGSLTWRVKSAKYVPGHQLDKLADSLRSEDIEIDAANVRLLFLDGCKHMVYQSCLSDSSRCNECNVTFIVQTVHDLLSLCHPVTEIFWAFIAIHYKWIV